MDSDKEAKITFEVQIKRLEGLPNRSIIRSSLAKRKWYAALNAGPFLDYKTEPRSRGADEMVTWDQTLTISLSVKAEHRAKIAIYRANDYTKHDKVAVTEEFDLVKISQTSVVSIDMHNSAREKDSFGRLIMSARIQLPKIELSLSKLDSKSAPLLGQLIKIPSADPSWQQFLFAFQQSIEVARQIAELNSTAKVAVGTISFAVTAVVKQIERDDRIGELRELMTSLLSFFCDIEPLRKSPFLTGVLDRLLTQVSECTYFIFQYQEIELFLQKAAICLVDGTDATINQFFSVFSNLRAELALGTSLQTAINTQYILNKVDEIDTFLYIKQLGHLKGTGWRSDKVCAAGTRDLTIRHILGWASNFESGPLTLVGPPGSGKSAVLHSVAEAFDEKQRLGACVFLDEPAKGRKTADSLMQTIVYYLALSNERLGKKIALALKKHPSLDSANAARYAKLLIDISSDLVLYGPLIVIVDGLHELETVQDLELVQNLIFEVASQAHHYLRLIMSSRMCNQSGNNTSLVWEIDKSNQLFPDSPIYLPDTFPILDMQAALQDYSLKTALDLQRLFGRHGMGIPAWISMVNDTFKLVGPRIGRAFVEILLSYTALPASVNEAFDRLLEAGMGALQGRITVLANELLCLPQSSILLVQKETTVPDKPPGSQHPIIHTLFECGCLLKKPGVQVTKFIAYEVRLELIPPCLFKVFDSTCNKPFLPIPGSPLNVYQICLREASAAENRGPVYARFALPASKPLLDGQKIKDQLRSYGVISNDLNKMSARSPPEGCEWVILHHGLFPLEENDGCTSVTVTTPVLTQAILERLTCIWIYWWHGAKEGTCLRLRDGREESNFLGWDSFNDVTYHETHAELVCDGERKGDLMPGDQIQVKATEDRENPWAVIGLALRY